MTAQSEAYERGPRGSKCHYFVHLNPKDLTALHEVPLHTQTLQLQGYTLMTSKHAAAQTQELLVPTSSPVTTPSVPISVSENVFITVLGCISQPQTNEV